MDIYENMSYYTSTLVLLSIPKKIWAGAEPASQTLGEPNWEKKKNRYSSHVGECILP
jgi:hypothetical protein